MAERPRSSPFAGLDKALLRSTQPPTNAPQEVPDPSPPPESEAQPTPRKSAKPTPSRRSAESRLSTPQAKDRASDNASTIASYPDELVATIRKIVRVPGREVSFVRLTPAEKEQLGEIVYTYKRMGKKTTENEINRIAVNFILEDYRANGEQSILARVIDALLA
jgi:hypothetical protein